MNDTDETADRLADRLAALEADNARLRRLLDEAGAPDSLRHAFRDTVGMLRAVVRRSAETAGDVGAYAAHLEGRIDTLARVRGGLDAFGEADLHGLVSDELLAHLAREGERAAIEGPRVRLRPKAAQVMALAVHELATNAVEHGALGLPEGRVTVTWRVEEPETGPVLALDWRETGGGGMSGPARRGFGTAVLEEMLAYQLGARAGLAFEPEGLRCALRLPFTGHVGRLCEEASEAADLQAPPPLRARMKDDA